VTVAKATKRLILFGSAAVGVLVLVWLIEIAWMCPGRSAAADTVVMLTLTPERSLGSLLGGSCRVDVWSATRGARIAEDVTVVDVRPSTDGGKRFVYLAVARRLAAPLVQLGDATLTLRERCAERGDDVLL
jgi:hypothetical protein